MKKTTPSGTRTLLTSRPLGRTEDSMISPTGSRSMAISSRAAAICSIRDVVNLNRSIAASLNPKPGAASRSWALPAKTWSLRSRSSCADSLSHSSFCAPLTNASSLAARWAACATSRQ
jgi:hypothetical protein